MKICFNWKIKEENISFVYNECRITKCTCIFHMSSIHKWLTGNFTIMSDV